MMPQNLDTAPPRLSPMQLAQADMIAAHGHAERALDALTRALARYTELGHADHAALRLRGRNAQRMLSDVLDRIDTTNGEGQENQA